MTTKVNNFNKFTIKGEAAEDYRKHIGIRLLNDAIKFLPVEKNSIDFLEIGPGTIYFLSSFIPWFKRYYWKVSRMGTIH